MIHSNQPRRAYRLTVRNLVRQFAIRTAASERAAQAQDHPMRLTTFSDYALRVLNRLITIEATAQT
jgi:hypothetical protein